MANNSMWFYMTYSLTATPTPPALRAPSLALPSDAARVCPRTSTSKEMMREDTMIQLSPLISLTYADVER